MKHETKIYCIKILAVVFFLLCAACTNASNSTDENYSTPADAALEKQKTEDHLSNQAKDEPGLSQVDIRRKTDFEKVTGLTLPETAQVLDYSNGGGIDEITKAKITMATLDFKKWITSYSLKPSHFSNDRRYMLGQNENWWDPLKPKTLPTAQVRFENGMVLNIGYVEVASDNLVIYLVFHST